MARTIINKTFARVKIDLKPYILNLMFNAPIQHPQISVIVPIYNSSKYLLECLTSIESQTKINIELILINDASTDNSLNILEEFKAKSELRDNILIISNPKNLGVAQTIHRGCKLVTSPYISIVDSDDILAPYSLKCVYDYMNKHKSCDLSWTLYEAMDEDGTNLRLGNRSKGPRPQSQKEVIIQNLIHFVTFHLITIRTKSYFSRNFSPWNNCKNPSGVDYEFILNNIFTQNMQRIDRVCYYYRTKVTNSISSNKSLQASMSAAARNRALAKAVDWNFINGKDILYINEQVRKFSKRKT